MAEGTDGVAPGLRLHRDPDAGFSVPVPSSWQLVEHSHPSAPLIALEPPHDGFRANLVVSIDALPPGTDLEGWQRGSDELLARTLPDYLLLDREHLQQEGRTVAVRRLALHTHEELAASVTMEQWARTAGGTGYTLTASAASLAYDSLADLFGHVADRFDVAAANGPTPSGPTPSGTAR